MKTINEILELNREALMQLRQSLSASKLLVRDLDEAFGLKGLIGRIVNANIQEARDGYVVQLEVLLGFSHLGKQGWKELEQLKKTKPFGVLVVF